MKLEPEFLAQNLHIYKSEFFEISTEMRFLKIEKHGKISTFQLASPSISESLLAAGGVSESLLVTWRVS